MVMAIDTELFKRAMHLSSEERAELALQLFLSLETDPLEQNVEQEWGAEIQRRIAANDGGEVGVMDADEAIAKAEASMDRRRGKRG
jgi:putative addiction module component (TIGR02574 family)